MSTVSDLILDRADDDGPALHFEGLTWSYRQLAEEARRRVGVYDRLHDAGAVTNFGILLDNDPEYLFWLAAAALRGAGAVGINSTYRGAELGQLIDHTDCEFVLTSRTFAPMLADAAESPDGRRVIDIDGPGYRDLLASVNPADAQINSPIDDETLFLLIFTSGSTGLPKAVRCTQGRFARTGKHVAAVAEISPGDAIYTSLPYFHSSSLFTGWAAALHAGIPLASRRKFSASKTFDDIRATGATVLTYTGKVLNYILAVPEHVDDHENPLRFAFGNEASASDIVDFGERFGCTVRDSYGSTEGVIIIRRDPAMPDGALGSAEDTVRVLDPDTGAECPRILHDAAGNITNLEEATGEIVETVPTNGFEGYYKNEAATRERFRDGMYWSGDLAYRDDAGWFFFAGRSNEWMRVDGENFAAGPVERIVGRHPAVRSCAVYAVPDDPVGDRVMVALELQASADFDPEQFDAFLADQADLGPKWVPSFIRLAEELPKLASMKIDKRRLRREAWRAEPTYWRPDRNQGLRRLDAADRPGLDRLLP